MSRFSHEWALSRGLVKNSNGEWCQPSVVKKSQATSFEPPSEPVWLERDLHDQIIRWITDHGWEIVHSRMDMRTSVDNGLPDFVIAAPNGRTYWVECKARKEKPKPDQVSWGIRLNNLSHVYGVAWNFQDFLKIIECRSDGWRVFDSDC